MWFSRLAQNLDAMNGGDSSEAKGNTTRGWFFSRMFSRSSKKDFQEQERDERNDEEYEQLSRKKQGWYCIPGPPLRKDIS